ncbi:hypothetical protein NKH77_06275 [Streptomyces sp. M19]
MTHGNVLNMLDDWEARMEPCPARRRPPGRASASTPRCTRS